MPHVDSELRAGLEKNENLVVETYVYRKEAAVAEGGFGWTDDARFEHLKQRVITGRELAGPDIRAHVEVVLVVHVTKPTERARHRESCQCF